MMHKDGLVLGKEAMDFLRAYGIPSVKTSVVKQGALSSLKPPFVLKAISPKIVHKAKSRAVEIIYDKGKAASAYSRMEKMGTVIVQPFSPGFELIIGIKRDPVFGHVILFGMGGGYVEAMGDVGFRAVPITRKDALSLIMGTKAYSLLDSKREKPDLSVLQDALMKVSRMALENPWIEELDINPFIFDGKRGWAVDARILRK